MVWGERSETFLYQEELIKFILSWKHWVAVDEFAQNATDSPDIDLFGIGSTYKQLRRAVPSSGYIVC